MYQNKRIYIELDDHNKVYSVKVLQRNSISMRVPLRSWTRLRTAPIDSKIIQQALQIREKNVTKSFHERDECNENGMANIINRMTRMEKSLKTIETTLKLLSDQMNQK